MNFILPGKLILSGLILIFFLPIFSSAQDTLRQMEKPVPFVDFGMQRGNFIIENSFLRGENLSKKPMTTYDAYNLRWGYQTVGDKPWEIAHLHPYYGIGLYVPNLYNTLELGRPYALYGFFGAPIKQWSRLSVDYEYNFGVSYGWKPYNKETNPYNTAIGARFAWYIGANLALKYIVTPNVSCNLGVGYIHFSNGTVRVPNTGLNLATPYLTLRYHLDKIRPMSTAGLTPFKPKGSFFVSVETGIHQVVRDTAYTKLSDYYIHKNFSLYVLSTGWQLQFSPKWTLTVGSDVSYDEAVNTIITADEYQRVAIRNAPVSFKINLNAFVGGEMLVNRFALLAQAGYVFWSEFDPSRQSRFFQRIGMKYYLSNRFFVGTQLKMYHLVRGTTMTWMLGFRFHK
ncbi:MAG: acyloxyacyl hydrolase [Bacteroidota bacterium]|nr:acyloxyacyl hydrolase [Bacteroidota bacterium]